MTIQLKIFHNHKSNSWALKRQKVRQKVKGAFCSSVEQNEPPDCPATFSTEAWQQGQVRQWACGGDPERRARLRASTERGTRKIWEQQNFLIRRRKCETHPTQTSGGLLWETLITCNDTAFSLISPWPLCWRNPLSMWVAAAFQRFGWSFHNFFDSFLFSPLFAVRCQKCRKGWSQQPAMTSWREYFSSFQVEDATDSYKDTSLF